MKVLWGLKLIQFLGPSVRKIIPGGAKRTHVFQIIVTLFIFNIKNYVDTRTTCNKCSFDYLN